MMAVRMEAHLIVKHMSITVYAVAFGRSQVSVHNTPHARQSSCPTGFQKDLPQAS